MLDRYLPAQAVLGDVCRGTTFYVGIVACIVEGLSALGIKLNEAANTVRGEELLLSTPDSTIPVWVVPTNEELRIARETAAVVEK